MAAWKARESGGAHDIRIFKEFYDYDLQTVAKALGAEEFSIVLFYEGNPQERQSIYTRIRDRICDLAQRFCLDHTPEEMKQTLQNFIRNTAWDGSAIRHSGLKRETGALKSCRITNIAHVKLSDLVGYDPEKEADGQYRSVCQRQKGE